MLIQTGYFYVDMNLLRKSSSNNECAIVSLDQLVVEISLEKLVVEITEQQYDAGKGSIHCANYVLQFSDHLTLFPVPLNSYRPVLKTCR